MAYEEVMRELKSGGNPANVAGMARFGINPAGTLGVSVPVLRAMAKRCGKDTVLAKRLWGSGVHEARILASLVAVPGECTAGLMDAWARDFDSWDVVDQCCANLFAYTPFAYSKATQWSRHSQEFVKRAGFVLMARLASTNKQLPDEAFAPFLDAIEREATDARNFVTKAINWALRQIGKRNPHLYEQAFACAEHLVASESKAARWVGRDALRELRNDKIRRRVFKR